MILRNGKFSGKILRNIFLKIFRTGKFSMEKFPPHITRDSPDHWHKTERNGTLFAKPLHLTAEEARLSEMKNMLNTFSKALCIFFVPNFGEYFPYFVGMKHCYTL
jgi:hypothetical protein